MCHVYARRSVAADGHVELRALRVQSSLEDAHLGCRTRHEHLLDAEAREQARELGALEALVGIL